LSIEEAGGAKQSETSGTAPTPKAEPAEKAKLATPKTEVEKESDADEEEGYQSKPGIAPAVSPSLRKLAQDLGIDLTRVRGSEPGGRIVMGDIRAYIQRLQARASEKQPKPAAETPAPSKPISEPIDFSKWGPITKKPLSPLRQVIARRMSENWNAVPHVTQFDEADVTELMALRKKYAGAYEQKGARLTLTGFALRAVVETLKKHPMLNSSLDGDEIVLKEYFHIGVAVDTEGGLIVPVIRDVDKKSVLDLSKELEELAKKARERKISAEELKGGTFTISNQGGIGGGHFTPIVNKPEVAILGLGRGSTKPVIREERVESRVLLPIALSYDHRVIDGGVAARFVVDLVAAFESFSEGNVKV
jgi:pyruvate dehydrogenase E2 component (dihydrolipoamide acetyltransferase)